ncbi:MAG: hypothetical protein MJ109_05025 [Kiritimatiellae bacterium]|nr:hypothetical protein [Kiritimatiellia bacterium]
MQIKKPASGGAAIADRFKLDVPAAKTSSTGTVGKTPAMIALIAGVLALALIGITTFTLYQHWGFLQGA